MPPSHPVGYEVEKIFTEAAAHAEPTLTVARGVAVAEIVAEVEGEADFVDEVVALEAEDAVELDVEVGGFASALHVKTTSPLAGAAA